MCPRNEKLFRHRLVGQPKFRNSHGQHPANSRVGVINRDLVPRLRQVESGRDTRRASTHNRHALAVLRTPVLTVFRSVNHVIRDEALELPDRHWYLGNVALATAPLTRGRTDLATDERQGIVLLHQRVGLFEAIVFDQLDVTRHIHVAGTGIDAGSPPMQEPPTDAEVTVFRHGMLNEIVAEQVNQIVDDHIQLILCYCQRTLHRRQVPQTLQPLHVRATVCNVLDGPVCRADMRSVDPHFPYEESGQETNEIHGAKAFAEERNDVGRDEIARMIPDAFIQPRTTNKVAQRTARLHDDRTRILAQHAAAMLLEELLESDVLIDLNATGSVNGANQFEFNHHSTPSGCQDVRRSSISTLSRWRLYA